MSGKIQRQYDEEFKKNAVKLSHASPKTVGQVAEDLESRLSGCMRGARSTRLTGIRRVTPRLRRKTKRCALLWRKRISRMIC